MLTVKLSGLALIAALMSPTLINAEDAMIQFPVSDPSQWDYFSDQVMGGVSEGRASFEKSGAQTILRLTGTVSTANRGGFIQARTTLDAPLPSNAKGIVMEVRGNNEPYYIHLRTSGTVLPWQFYQAPFKAPDTWQEVRIPFTEFSPYGGLLRQSFDVQKIRSVAVVAFGKDYTADLSVRAIGVYD